ncbi:hypothetical protein O4H49_13325 [Kiloniella laminariae]|uniref:Uncharacterized protein n=1 Tax=Kiloniella laminariae TaxID=454162 RepID=A0ABT4LL08_9PROT|nr:hypothetical protein [Kiloniella laminariae]MCZ4281766.1 hypothetical protein [Kiloniella laminariae]
MSWVLPGDQETRLRIAKGYPFEAPPSSYLFEDGQVRLFSELQGEELAHWNTVVRQRTAVIAHGSNRAPEQLARKFAGHLSAGEAIPVTAIWLKDHEVVYSAHVTRYGSVAAELIHCPGTAVQVFVTWLDQAQLLRMHESELPSENYTYGHLDCDWISADLRTDHDAEQGSVCRDISLPSVKLMVYRSTAGALSFRGEAVAISALPARGRSLQAWQQCEVLQHVHQVHGLRQCDLPELLDQAILEAIDSSDYRRRLVRSLKKQSLDVPHPSYTIYL